MANGLPDRFWSKVAAEAKGGCWIWTAGTSRGYGQFFESGRMRPAHRISYEALVGPIPPDRDLDHLCRTRVCCNPMHLEIVTRRVNLLRGETVTARNAAATHCPKGHPYDNANTGSNGPGRRRCRACDRIRSKRSYAERTARC